MEATSSLLQCRLFTENVNKKLSSFRHTFCFQIPTSYLCSVAYIYTHIHTYSLQTKIKTNSSCRHHFPRHRVLHPSRWLESWGLCLIVWLHSSTARSCTSTMSQVSHSAEGASNKHGCQRLSPSLLERRKELKT